jgi:mannose-6-phosphate isomerase-like protein (cupin superfamily)
LQICSLALQTIKEPFIVRAGTNRSGAVSTPLDIHDHQDEFFTVIEGKYKFVCGDMVTELSAGDSIFLPRKIAHQWLQPAIPMMCY